MDSGVSKEDVLIMSSIKSNQWFSSHRNSTIVRSGLLTNFFRKQVEIPIKKRFSKKLFYVMSYQDIEVMDLKNMKVKDRLNAIESDCGFTKNTLAF
jgi:hypothetical protein